MELFPKVLPNALSIGKTFYHPQCKLVAFGTFWNLKHIFVLALLMMYCSQ